MRRAGAARAPLARICAVLRLRGAQRTPCAALWRAVRYLISVCERAELQDVAAEQRQASAVDRQPEARRVAGGEARPLELDQAIAGRTHEPRPAHDHRSGGGTADGVTMIHR